MSSLSEMRSAVAEQERINTYLNNQLYSLANGIANSNSRWNQLTGLINNTLINGVKRVSDSHERTLQAYELQVEIEKMYALFKNIELANKKIRACKNKVYYEFADYRAVRKIVQAILNNIETTFVSDATIMKAVEKKHLQLPDYWLTCALLSIMAWRNDDRELAQRALDRACRLDKKDASAFFFAFHVRMGLDSVALKWFNSYIECELTGEDQSNVLLMFAIINKTISAECDENLISNVNKFINKLINDNLHANGYSEAAMVERVRKHLGAFYSDTAFDYPFLSKYTTESEYLNNELVLANGNIAILDFILKTVNITVEEKNEFLNQFIDDLIAKTNSVERDTANEIKYNELIIEHNGEIKAAKEEYKEWQVHNKTHFEIISEMIEWIYNSDAYGMNRVIRRMMFIITKNITEKAVERNVDFYRGQYRSRINIKINEYESQAELSDPVSEQTKIETYFNERAERLMAKEKIWPSFIWFGVAAAGIAGSIAAAPAFLVLTLAGAVGGTAKLIMTDRKKKRIRKDNELLAQNTKSIYGSMVREFADYEKKYREYDSYYDRIKEEFAKLN